MKRQHCPHLSSFMRLSPSSLSRSRRRTVPASAARGRRDGNPISRPSWKRWMDLRLVAVRSRPRRAAPVAAVAEDFIWCRSNESPRWEGWWSAARQLVQDNRCSLAVSARLRTWCCVISLRLG
ncbi:hypothetical protein PVAP13_5NG229100 [Panicum virgatum]|uniref:Uncharacterized protein n=1 Tax=Panicum virgatum TaxID=38727 RepID=A0A8T0RR89_PANVG|nr:hypothetical protein PVAP13_5NG229100 [Panicum virgatum]